MVEHRHILAFTSQVDRYSLIGVNCTAVESRSNTGKSTVCNIQLRTAPVHIDGSAISSAAPVILRSAKGRSADIHGSCRITVDRTTVGSGTEVSEVSVAHRQVLTRIAHIDHAAMASGHIFFWCVPDKLRIIDLQIFCIAVDKSATASCITVCDPAVLYYCGWMIVSCKINGAAAATVLRTTGFDDSSVHSKTSAICHIDRAAIVAGDLRVLQRAVKAAVIRITLQQV